VSESIHDSTPMLTAPASLVSITRLSLNSRECDNDTAVDVLFVRHTAVAQGYDAASLAVPVIGICTRQPC
jgi:hypothetical protein